MDIAAMSMAQASTQLQTEASMKVMSNVKDVMNQQGEQMIDMLSSATATHPTLGQSIDIQG